MPPRKSDISKAATGDEETPARDLPRDAVNLEDLNLPKSIVTRLAKGVLPPNTQIQGNAMLAMTKSATVFVNYLTSHANERAVGQNRKTIGPQDVFQALEELEFGEFRGRLEMELARFNELQADKRNAYRKKVADKSQGGDEERAVKKIRMEEEEGAEVAEEEEEEEEREEEEDVEEEDEDESQERMDVEERLEDIDTREPEPEDEDEDEALDNGDDSE